MKISEKDVSYVADLAHLELTAEERSQILRDLTSILDYVNRLNELDTAEVAPMAHVFETLTADATRADILESLRKSLSREVVLQVAPGSDGTFFKVPKVIERS